jgi:hypothetical protein
MSNLQGVPETEKIFFEISSTFISLRKLIAALMPLQFSRGAIKKTLCSVLKASNSSFIPDAL